jgi:hypothetical protein
MFVFSQIGLGTLNHLEAMLIEDIGIILFGIGALIVNADKVILELIGCRNE